MMNFADCLSCLAFFMELGEDHVGGAFPDTLEDSVYRMKKIYFLSFFPVIYIFIVILITMPLICLLLWQSLSTSLLCFYLRGFGAPM